MNHKGLISCIFIFICILTGCRDHEIYDDNSISRISFAAINKVNDFTRGTPVTSSNDIANICVYGYYTGNGTDYTWDEVGSTAEPSLFDGLVVTNNGVGTGTSSWSYSKLTYWPAYDDANVTFFSYSPTATDENGISVLSTTGVPVLHYSTPTTTANQPDLMVAAPKYNLNISSGTTVTFVMQHALSCIGFEGMGEDKVVTSISLSGISLEGDLSMDGSTVSWSNLSAPDTTSIQVGLDNDTLSMTMSTELTASNGYLMLIPQKLGSDAKVTLKIEGEDDLVFNLPDTVLTAGDRHIYQLIVDRPEAVLTFNPSELTVNALKSIDTISITSTPDYGTWTLTSPESWLTFSLNGDGSDASATVSGIGNAKVYAIIAENLINSGQNRTATIYPNNNSSDGTITITQNSMSYIPSSRKSYAGAFWRCDQVGERLIHIDCEIGDWNAYVYKMDSQWEEGDIVLDGSSFAWPPTTVSTGEDTPPVESTATSISGNTSSSSSMYFRVGLKNTYTPTSTYPARYAMIAITWDEGKSAQFFFVRQGEDPDYLMRPTDIYGSTQSWASGPTWRPLANKVSPFNLTADTLNMQCNRARTGNNPSRFTEYPTQTGALFQWANATYPRYAYSPTQNADPWNYTSPSGYWSTLQAEHESAPIDYPLTYGGTVNFRRPSDGSITGPAASTPQTSEIVQSFFYTPFSPVDNMIYAYLADGFFDRSDISSDNGTSTGTDEAAYWGQLVYNPISMASIFVPFSGFISGEGGVMTAPGEYINIWTASCANETTTIIWNYSFEDGGGLYNNNREAGFTVRPVIENGTE